MKKKLIVIAGATATGKTALAIELAKRLDTEIISADSMQVYRYMDIGTAKPSYAEMAGIKHHMIDIIDPDEAFSVAQYVKQAKEAMEAIYNKNKIPVVVGGTGFYINALIKDTNFEDTFEDHAYRLELEAIVEKQGASILHGMLASVDPASANKIHPNNVKRVIRALEFYRQTGISIWEHNEKEKLKHSPYDLLFYVLQYPWAVLYDRINQRVDQMVANGLVQEVESLLHRGYDSGLAAMQAIGYKETVDYLEGIISRTEAIDKIKQETRHYAKRQFTWFRHQVQGTEIDMVSKDTVAKVVMGVEKKYFMV